MRSILATCFGPSGARWPSHAGGFSLLVLNDGSRGSVSPGKSLALRGAGVYGACGANVATSTANGVRPRTVVMNDCVSRVDHVDAVVVLPVYVCTRAVVVEEEVELG